MNEEKPNVVGLWFIRGDFLPIPSLRSEETCREGYAEELRELDCRERR